ncbi:hypothetical protein [Solimonas sp. SE-A11]|uniref:hypothetical protein n=1 Tax=Solimonas sp. SE-A11 TaxID=3054954 RepID=UPI00259C96F1|nr:hypothetical protein [Solimonas sp. SE-A11]MDM4770878.1 hypothetical protein [Solimonas sp. SE-A11]
MEVTFLQWKCQAVFGKYRNGRIAIQLVAAGDASGDVEVMCGEPIATATVNVDRIALEADEVLIKDYAENEGMSDALVAAGLVQPLLKVIHIGGFQAQCAIGRLTPTALQAAGLAH